MTEPQSMDHDLRSRVVALEQSSASRDQRLIVVETWQRQADIGTARRDVEFKGMDDRFGRIETDLQKISNTLSRIMWLVIGGIISGMVAFLMSGGFKIPS